MSNTLNIKLINNKTGEIEQDITAENYIVPNISSQLKAISLRYLLYGNTNLRWGINSRTYTYSDYILLSNNTTAINTSSSYSEETTSTIIGYAAKDSAYAGSDVKRGTINLNESYSYDNKALYTFDFATDKANGTFQSIMFSNAYPPTVSYNEIKSVYPPVTSTAFPAGVARTYYNGYYYCQYSNSQFLKISETNPLIYEYITKTATDSAGGIQPATDGAYIYTTNGATVVKKYDMSGTFIGDIYTAVANIYGLFFYNGLIYLYINNGASSAVVKITTTGTLDSTINGFIYSDTNTRGFFVTSDYIYTASTSSSGHIDKYNHSGVIVSSYTNTNPNGLYSITKITGDVLEIVMPTAQYSSNGTSPSLTNTYPICSIDLSKPQNMMSRILLPSPITKTSAQTMKITYTINIS